MSLPDYYTVLGVQRDARQVQIKKAYFELAKQMHPDRHHGTDVEEGATRAFEHLQKAYSVLSNPEKRRAYDATLGDNGEGAAAQAFRGQGTGPLGGPSWLHRAEDRKRPWYSQLAFRRLWYRASKTVGGRPSFLGPVLFVAGVFTLFRGIPLGVMYMLDDKDRVAVLSPPPVKRH
ncbi:Dnajb14 [Symbiodinium necroappetens]|uniref:Dnajb14 protein n=2 Tax=Symbiodinium TaxID=2949 RepID=A0A812ZYX9_9DINO|nr:DnaJ-like subfamily B member 14 [Symbiodinium microadriaticum]CAE7386453.1 Dnajb14 [Symbiodinium microadriaticum]CAE7842709.1 Dnajb14 [Symbiodinium necroappetens]CAE7949526.1 Dnajb14 [Symbiodinium sp. KB8]